MKRHLIENAPAYIAASIILMGITHFTVMGFRSSSTTEVSISGMYSSTRIPNNKQPVIIILYYDPDNENPNGSSSNISSDGPTWHRVWYRDKEEYEKARKILLDLPSIKP